MDAQWGWLDRNDLSLLDQPWPSLSNQVEEGAVERNLFPFEILPPPSYKVVFSVLQSLCEVGTGGTSTSPQEAASQGTSDALCCKWTLKWRKPLFLRPFKVLINSKASYLCKYAFPWRRTKPGGWLCSWWWTAFLPTLLQHPSQRGPFRRGPTVCIFSIQARKQLGLRQLTRRDGCWGPVTAPAPQRWVSRGRNTVGTWGSLPQFHTPLYPFHS